MESPMSSSGSERDVNLPEVKDYIGLGCLCLFPDGESPHEQTDRIEWRNIAGSESLRAILPSELAFVVRLHGMQWIQLYQSSISNTICLRVYYLPDDARQSLLDRQSKALRTDLGHLCSRLDTSQQAWGGNPHSSTRLGFDLWATGVHCSLFWLFNSLPSPATDTACIKDRYARHAAEVVLQGVDCEQMPAIFSLDPGVSGVPDLKATLYSYQARTLAAMIQRETNPSVNLDPRYELRKAPDGSTYYYNTRDLLLRRSQPQYEGNRGGILAETMGVGKTVIIIALILATRFHLPQIPPQYSGTPMIRPSVGRLTDMAITMAGRSAVPLKSHLHMHHHDIYPHLEAQIDAAPTYYAIPYYMRRSNRKNSVVPPPRSLRLCSASIIVVPRNLLRQWQAELKKHANISLNGLRVLVLEKASDVLPHADEIARYDILLFSKSRFEQEAKDGMDNKGRSTTNVRAGCQCPYIGATRVRDCTCLRPEEVYQSPLKDLHFLRLVVDEGHDFSSSSSNAVRVATTLVSAERRWIVSGTPAKERLFGADVEMASATENDDIHTAGPAQRTKVGRISDVLADRKSFVRQEELNGASKSLGVLLANFLRVRPWAGTDEEIKVEWEDFAFRHETFRGRTHSAFSQCMVSTLNASVLKTRPEDVERDVVLPPLHVSVKLLEPSYYDIITLNLFNFVILSNAVTSERTDVDYLFHKNSTASRHSLVRNLRASPFFWTGWANSDILASIGHAERYMAKKDTLCSIEDRKELTDRVTFAKRVLDSKGWNAMSRTHELPMFVQQWPDEHQHSWSLDHDGDLSLIGASQLHAAQEHVNARLFDENPTENLAALGKTEVERAFTVEEKEQKTRAKEGAVTKNGIPVSGIRDKQFDSRNHASSKMGQPKRSIPKITKQQVDVIPKTVKTSSPKRKCWSPTDDRELQADSFLARAAVVGTVSSKLSYLLSRVQSFQAEEKILIFYDSDNIAYYVSQALDLFHIKHLIYARTLNVEQRSKYIVTFGTDTSVRVLLMDVNHGALGLNINKASRIFFINPPCMPHIEAQAIKRAHRIGQTREVFVETLVLRGTVEEAIWRRSKQMTREEHESVGKEISNDSGVARIIQEAKSIPLPNASEGQMAPLDIPLQVFGRSDRRNIKIKDIDAEEDVEKKPPRKRARKVTFASFEPATSGSASIAADTPTTLHDAASIFG